MTKRIPETHAESVHNPELAAKIIGKAAELAIILSAADPETRAEIVDELNDELLDADIVVFDLQVAADERIGKRTGRTHNEVVIASKVPKAVRRVLLTRRQNKNRDSNITDQEK